ncbi:Holliday junction branch migration protein RuvA [Nannocystis sp.]|uniref:Holliday junction branch migration protein RuvA n=1 Tax=Nannocystis sp. TaxID=1962667 RepID=UPI002421BF57|nr:Holliday junction branch migration protein RuvA [Nannocystis sp.]MBK7823805.1 Holliday junction branch migration protein RuvA [Nannocystis sp.]MBK9755678.1 Holliday junction branch migration protein RuvA [Nannocystis sp.]
MIGWLSGVVVARDAAQGVVVINVSGVGYEVRVSLQTLAEVGDLDELCTLWIYTYVREDQLLLYGFASPAEKRLFLLLNSVPKVGPKHALAALGGFPFAELVDHLRQGRHDQLQKIPGIGKKTAEQILLSLGDKVGDLITGEAIAVANVPRADGGSGLQDEARAVLVELGWRLKEVDAAIARVVAAGWKDADGALDDLVRRALAQLMER